MEPGERCLDFPPPLVAPPLPPVLRRQFLPIRVVQRDQLNARSGEFGVEQVGVVSLDDNLS
jgi:hypothetical protein